MQQRGPPTVPIGAGLFGCASGTENGSAFIGHFTLKDVDISGVYLIGGAVGLQFMNCPVSDIHLVGDNHLTGMQGIGGIVGTGFDLISDCRATADITAMGDDGACAGLIAGGTTMSPIKKCEVIDGSITAKGKLSGRRTETTYKADLGRTTLRNKRKSNAARTPYSRCGGRERKAIVLTRGDLQDKL